MGDMKRQERTIELLRCATTTVNKSQALTEFKNWDITKTGENIGHWLEDIHKGVGCKPEYISSQNFDGSSNAGASIDNL